MNNGSSGDKQIWLTLSVGSSPDSEAIFWRWVKELASSRSTSYMYALVNVLVSTDRGSSHLQRRDRNWDFFAENELQEDLVEREIDDS